MGNLKSNLSSSLHSALKGDDAGSTPVDPLGPELWTYGVVVPPGGTAIKTLS